MLSCEQCFLLRILYDGVQQLSAENNFRLIRRPFQIIYYMQSQPEFRRNWSCYDVRRDVWEQKGIPLSLLATRARRLWKLFSSLPPNSYPLFFSFFFFPLFFFSFFFFLSPLFSSSFWKVINIISSAALTQLLTSASLLGVLPGAVSRASPKHGVAPAPAPAREDVFKGGSSCKWQGFLPAALVGLAEPGFTPVLPVLRGAGCWLPSIGLLQETGLLTRVTACGDLASPSCSEPGFFFFLKDN